jgi:hypothetical protein
MVDAGLADERTPLLADTLPEAEARTPPESQDAQPDEGAGGGPAHHDAESPYLIPASRARFWFMFTPILLQYLFMFDAYFIIIQK